VWLGAKEHADIASTPSTKSECRPRGFDGCTWWQFSLRGELAAGKPRAPPGRLAAAGPEHEPIKTRIPGLQNKSFFGLKLS
jgi:hypothetical protein